MNVIHIHIDNNSSTKTEVMLKSLAMYILFSYKIIFMCGTSGREKFLKFKLFFCHECIKSYTEQQCESSIHLTQLSEASDASDEGKGKK